MLSSSFSLVAYDDVVQRIYAAALKPSELDDVLGAICSLMQCNAGNFFTWTRTPAQGGFFFTRFSPAILQRYLARHVDDDPFILASVSRGLMYEGSAVLSDDLLSREELFKTRLYQELWEPAGVGQMMAGVVFDADDGHRLPTALSVHRPLKAPRFTHDELDAFRRIVVHLSRALGVMFHLRDQKLQVAASRAALDRLSAGIVVLEPDRRIGFANRSAQSIFESKTSVVIDRDAATGLETLTLSKRLRPRELAFQTAIANSLKPLASDADGHFSDALILEGMQGEPLYVLHVAPLPPMREFEAGDALPRAIVFIYDLEAATSVPIESSLVKVFGLTLSEARAALESLKGGSVENMATRLGVSMNTLKTQLKEVYQKCGVRQRVDLLKLLLSLARR